MGESAAGAHGRAHSASPWRWVSVRRWARRADSQAGRRAGTGNAMQGRGGGGVWEGRPSRVAREVEWAREEEEEEGRGEEGETD